MAREKKMFSAIVIFWMPLPEKAPDHSWSNVGPSEKCCQIQNRDCPQKRQPVTDMPHTLGYLQGITDRKIRKSCENVI